MSLNHNNFGSCGVVGHAIKPTKVDSRTKFESLAIEGDSPVGEINNGGEHVPEYGGTRGTLPESGWTIIQG